MLSKLQQLACTAAPSDGVVKKTPSAVVEILIVLPTVVPSLTTKAPLSSKSPISLLGRSVSPTQSSCVPIHTRTFGTLAPSASTLTVMVAVRDSASVMLYSRVTWTVAPSKLTDWLTISVPCPSAVNPEASTVGAPDRSNAVPDVWESALPPAFMTKSSDLVEYVSFLHSAPFQ